nr:MAG TPA: hypothetical protein [Caudoviricetes sp.]
MILSVKYCLNQSVTDTQQPFERTLLTKNIRL